MAKLPIFLFVGAFLLGVSYCAAVEEATLNVPANRITSTLTEMALKLKDLQDLKKFPFINVDKFTGNEGNCTLVDETSGDKNCYMVNTEMQVQVDQNLEATFSLNMTLHFTIANEIITKITVANVDVKGIFLHSAASEDTILKNQGRLNEMTTYLQGALMKLKIFAEAIDFKNHQDGTIEKRIFVILNGGVPVVVPTAAPSIVTTVPPPSPIGRSLRQLAAQLKGLPEFKKYPFEKLDSFTASETDCKTVSMGQMDCYLVNHQLVVELATGLQGRLDTSITLSFTLVGSTIEAISIKEVSVRQSFIQGSSSGDIIQKNSGRLNDIVKYVIDSMLKLKVDTQTLTFDDSANQEKPVKPRHNWASKEGTSWLLVGAIVVIKFCL